MNHHIPNGPGPTQILILVPVFFVVAFVVKVGWELLSDAIDKGISRLG